MNAGMVALHVTPSGFEEYLRSVLPDYAGIVNGVASAILNEGKQESTQISTQLKQPLVIINNVFETFERRGLIEVAKSTTGQYFVTSTSIEFKRMLR